MKNGRLSGAICSSLEIIDEAANKIDREIKTEYLQIPWRELNDIRHKIIHHYFGIDYDIVWDRVKTDIPVLQEWISLIVNKQIQQG